MLTVYLTSLVVGGVFVGLSSLGAFGQDAEADVGPDVDADVDVDVDADVDMDMDAGADLDADAHMDVDAGHALALADGSHGLAPRGHRGKRIWLPFLSFRFWTFGSAFFGLSGALLTTLTGAGGVLVAALSTTMGVGVGSLSAGLVRWLRKPVGETVRRSDFAGQIGEVLLPLREGGVTRIRLHFGGRDRLMLARALEPLALPAGTRIVVLGLDETGKAQIAPEETIYRSED